jgi:hypothetical protein
LGRSATKKKPGWATLNVVGFREVAYVDHMQSCDVESDGNRMVKLRCVYFDSYAYGQRTFRLGKDLSDSNCILN